jgi:topoisomerase IA-like protein
LNNVNNNGENSELNVNVNTNVNINTNVKSIGEYHIKIGKYGPYILFNSKFYKINDKYEPKDLSEEDCKKIISENGTNKKKVSYKNISQSLL